MSDIFEAKDFKELEPIFLDRARRSGYVCPVCSNGSGEDGDGIERWDGDNRYHCFKCGWHGDVLDLFGEKYNISDMSEKIKSFKEFYHITDTTEISVPENSRPRKEVKTVVNQMNYINVCAERNDGKYLLNRNISIKTQKYFRIGFDPEWRSPVAQEKMINEGKDPSSIPASPRCIIPHSRCAYMARDTREAIPSNQERYAKMIVGEFSLFHPIALNADKILVVEGEIDALSAYDAGMLHPVGLCGTSGVRLLVDALKAQNHRPVCLLMLDNDDAGRKAQEQLKTELEKIGVCYDVVPYAHDVKDPNEFWQRYPEQFKKLIETYVDSQDSAYKTADRYLDYFLHIESSQPIYEAKTGFPCLDDEEKFLYGGIHEGLSILGALSGEGKTTFSNQLACQIAQRGKPVLYFASEPRRCELIAKSLSRETYIIAGSKKTEDDHFIAKDYYQIINGRSYKRYTDEEKAVINQAINNYASYAANIVIIEGDDVLKKTNGKESMTVNYIVNAVNDYIDKTGKKPFVIVDYLQYLAPVDPRMSDKMKVDHAVYSLKSLVTLQQIPVFAISSFNRESYMEPVSMTSYKESGGIEYTADCLFGIQQHGMDYNDGDYSGKQADRTSRIRVLRKENEAKMHNKIPVTMDFKCLKQRNGMRFDMTLEYIAAFNYFIDRSNFVPVDPSDVPFESCHGTKNEEEYKQLEIKKY